VAKKRKRQWVEIPHIGQRVRLLENAAHYGVKEGQTATVIGYTIYGWPDTQLEMAIALEDGRVFTIIHGRDPYELVWGRKPNSRAYQPAYPLVAFPWMN